MDRTRLSSKGQVVLPKGVREARGWYEGTEFVIESHPDGVLLRPAKPFPPTRPEDVFGCLKHVGPPRSIAEMDEGVRRMAARRYRGR